MLGSWLTVALHSLIFGQPRQSICARAWDKRATSRAARLVVLAFGEAHCRKSWRWHREHLDPWDVS